MKKILSQRGAMFGLDARIALAIIAALSLVGGVTMFTTSSEIHAKSLVKDLEAYKTAINSMQYDFKARPTAAITVAGDTQKVIRALQDKTEVDAAYQPRWLGPYLKARTNDISKHEYYGDIQYFIIPSGDFGCVPNFCNFLGVEEVPYKDFLVANTLIDGPDEGTPETEGRLRWAATYNSYENLIGYNLGRAL